MTRRLVPMACALAACVAFAFVGVRQLHATSSPSVGAVYTMSNGATGNRVMTFHRLPDGRLIPGGHTSTGGVGTGGGLGNQGGLVLTRNERWLLAVNAGSHSVAVLEVRPLGLVLRHVQPSGGTQPVSIATHGNLVYVLNAGSDDITGFRLDSRGTLAPIPGSTRQLSAAGVAPAQVEFSPDGSILAVTEKATNRIVTFVVGPDGLTGPANVQVSAGQTPFGFAFGRRGTLLVSEAFGGAPDGSALSSYTVDDAGGLDVVSASVGTTETAACWVALTPDGRFAYVTNTGSGTVSGYRVGFGGEVALLDADGRTASTGAGSGPIDLAVSSDARVVYTLHAGTQSIGAFRIRSNGSLVPLPFVGGLPRGANGLAVR